MIDRHLLDASPWAEPLADLLQNASLDALATLGRPATDQRDPIMMPLIEGRRRFQLGLLSSSTAGWAQWSDAVRAARPRWVRAGRSWALWQALAHVDFSGLRFTRELDMSARDFPGALSLVGAQCEGDAYLTAIRVGGDFRASRAHFAEGCWFDQVDIGGETHLDHAQLDGRLEARSGRFHGRVVCERATFGQDAWYSGSHFAGDVDFSGATFRSDAGFGRCRFGGRADFDAVAFQDLLGMEGCTFAGELSFRRAEFTRASFFDGASFAREPIVGGASFARAPSLNGARFPDQEAPPTGQDPATHLRAAGQGR